MLGVKIIRMPKFIPNFTCSAAQFFCYINYDRFSEKVGMDSPPETCCFIIMVRSCLGRSGQIASCHLVKVLRYVRVEAGNRTNKEELNVLIV